VLYCYSSAHEEHRLMACLAWPVAVVACELSAVCDVDILQLSNARDC
jgi:hypothetical protein